MSDLRVVGSKYPAYRPIPRFLRQIRITEKIDGTNGLIYIHDNGYLEGVGSRNRWLTDEKDNFGFRAWVLRNESEILKLGPGLHYGEWYGAGIQRGYDLAEKRFMLFRAPEVVPTCCEVATVLYEGPYSEFQINYAMNSLVKYGSFHVRHYHDPEGIVVEWEKVGGPKFKITLNGDGHKING